MLREAACVADVEVPMASPQVAALSKAIGVALQDVDVAIKPAVVEALLLPELRRVGLRMGSRKQQLE